MGSVRLFGRAYPHGGRPVTHLRLRVVARGLPEGAVVRVTDVALQAGAAATGWAPASVDQGIVPVERWQFRNGVVRGDMTVIVAADVEEPSPTRWDAREAGGSVQVGGYRFGRVHGSASVDGAGGTATQGAGIVPHLTGRADVDVPVSVEGGALLCCWFRGLARTDVSIVPGAGA